MVLSYIQNNNKNMLIQRTGDSRRYKHYRGQKKENGRSKPVEIYCDLETMTRNNLARENALQAYNERRLHKQGYNGIVDTAEALIKERICIWRAVFERAYDKMNNKINALMQQVKESDEKAQVLNEGFHDRVNSMNEKFYTDVDLMTRESQKRNVGFLKKSQAQKFIDDLGALTRENNKRNFGFHNKTNKENQASKFKKMCEESRKRDSFYQSRKKFTQMDRMAKMNDNRTASFMGKRPDSKFDAVLSLNDRRTAGFTNIKPMTKLEEITKWNGQRNAVFSLRS